MPAIYLTRIPVRSPANIWIKRLAGVLAFSGLTAGVIVGSMYDNWSLLVVAILAIIVPYVVISTILFLRREWRGVVLTVFLLLMAAVLVVGFVTIFRHVDMRIVLNAIFSALFEFFSNINETVESFRYERS